MENARIDVSMRGCMETSSNLNDGKLDFNTHSDYCTGDIKIQEKKTAQRPD
jgi:hypothetical protein